MDKEHTQIDSEHKEEKKTLDSKIIAQAIIVAGVLIAGAILLRGSTSPLSKPSTNESPSLSDVKITPVTDLDHILGNKEAKIVIVEYSDIECPFCKIFHDTMQKIIKEKGDTIAWVYRHYPVPSLHQNAYIESLATECAWEQGGNEAFWRYLDETIKRTTSNDGLDLTELPKIALEQELDVEKFNSCLENEKYGEKITSSMEEGTSLGVQLFGRGLGTPTSFILKDGIVVDVIIGAQPYEAVIETLSEY